MLILITYNLEKVYNKKLIYVREINNIRFYSFFSFDKDTHVDNNKIGKYLIIYKTNLEKEGTVGKLLNSSLRRRVSRYMKKIT